MWASADKYAFAFCLLPFAVAAAYEFPLIASTNFAYYFRSAIKMQLKIQPMKKAIGISVFLFSSFSFLNLNAQQNAYAVPASNTTNSASASAAAPYGVNTKVFQAFNESFQNATNVAWSPTATSTTVHFKQNGVASRGYFDQSGRLNFTVKDYFGSQVPRSVLNTVRRNGYNMNIIVAHEVTNGRISTFIVKMRDDKQIVTVQITGTGDLIESQVLQVSK